MYEGSLYSYLFTVSPENGGYQSKLVKLTHGSSVDEYAQMVHSPGMLVTDSGKIYAAFSTVLEQEDDYHFDYMSL